MNYWRVNTCMMATGGNRQVMMLPPLLRGTALLVFMVKTPLLFFILLPLYVSP